MATKDLIKRGKPEDIHGQAMTMALAILSERIRSLSKEDKVDLYDLLKEIPNAETHEELEEVVIGMKEILDQEPVQLSTLDFTENNGNGLQTWIDFVRGRIKQKREASGPTQTQLAKKSGLPQSHISRLEAGKHSPSRATLERIANALGVALDELDPSA